MPPYYRVCTVLHVYARSLGETSAQRGLLFPGKRRNLCAESLPASLGVKERLKTVISPRGAKEGRLKTVMGVHEAQRGQLRSCPFFPFHCWRTVSAQDGKED